MSKFEKVDNPRIKRTEIRLTESEKEELKTLADSTALSESEFMRRCAFGRRIISKADKVAVGQLRQLVGFFKDFHNKTEGQYADQTEEILEEIYVIVSNMANATGGK